MAAVGIDWAWKKLTLRPRCGACLGGTCIVGGYPVWEGDPIAYWLPTGQATGPDGCLGLVGLVAWQGSIWAVGWTAGPTVDDHSTAYLEIWRWDGNQWQHAARLGQFEGVSWQANGQQAHRGQAEHVRCYMAESRDGRLLIRLVDTDPGYVTLAGFWVFDGGIALPLVTYTAEQDDVTSGRFVKWRGRWWTYSASGDFDTADTIGEGQPGTSAYRPVFTMPHRRPDEDSVWTGLERSEFLAAAGGRRMLWCRADYLSSRVMADPFGGSQATEPGIISHILAVEANRGVVVESEYWFRAVWASDDGTIWAAAYKLSDLTWTPGYADYPWHCYVGSWPGYGRLFVEALEIEYSDGSRTHEPSVDTLVVEFSADRRPQRPTLNLLALEYSDGSRLHAPAVDTLAVEFSDGTGPGRPQVDAIALEFGQNEWGREPVVDAMCVEYGLGRATGPADGERVLLLEPVTSDDPILAVRVVLAGLSEVQLGQCRCIARADRESLPADDWGTYEQFEPDRNYYLVQPGRTVRIGVIGPAGAPAPDVFVQLEV